MQPERRGQGEVHLPRYDPIDLVCRHCWSRMTATKADSTTEHLFCLHTGSMPTSRQLASTEVDGTSRHIPTRPQSPPACMVVFTPGIRARFGLQSSIRACACVCGAGPCCARMWVNASIGAQACARARAPEPGRGMLRWRRGAAGDRASGPRGGQAGTKEVRGIPIVNDDHQADALRAVNALASGPGTRLMAAICKRLAGRRSTSHHKKGAKLGAARPAAAPESGLNLGSAARGAPRGGGCRSRKSAPWAVSSNGVMCAFGVAHGALGNGAGGMLLQLKRGSTEGSGARGGRRLRSAARRVCGR
jgi:hypothetical protein